MTHTHRILSTLAHMITGLLLAALVVLFLTGPVLTILVAVPVLFGV